MKRIFAFLASAVLACSLLAAPCFAAEPEPLPVPLPVPLPGVTDPEQPEKPDGPEVQPYEAMPGIGDMD